MTTVLAILFVLVCLFMVLVILIQKPRGGGLSGAFGGAGGSAQSVFGSKTGDVATWFTVAMFVCFIFLAMGMQWSIDPQSAREADVTEVQTPKTVPTPQIEIGEEATEPTPQTPPASLTAPLPETDQ